MFVGTDSAVVLVVGAIGWRNALASESVRSVSSM